jgi:transcription elongation factor Elf1
MGKKHRGRKIKPQKRVYKLPKFFSCPSCMKPDSVKVQISTKDGTAEIRCRACGVGEEGIVTDALTEPIDIYDEWMDTWRDANSRFNAKPRVLDEEERAQILNRHRHHEEIVYDTSNMLRRPTQDSGSSDSTMESADLEESD